jgi:hypothetical protein
MLGVVVVCAAIHRVDTDADVDVVGDKLRYFRAHADDYTVVFVGSSYVYREVSPAEFDAVTSERGVATRSFNFGIPGMDPPETYYLVDRILDAHPSRIAWVVIELDYFRAVVRPANLHTRRFDYWHDTRRTVQATRGAFTAGVPIGKRVKDAGAHLEAYVRELFAVGRGRALVGALLGSSQQAPDSLGANHDGYRSLDEEASSRFEVRRGFYQALEEDRYEDKLATLKAGGDAEGGPEAAGEIDVEALRVTIDRVRASGARPILLLPPCLATRADLMRLGDRGIDADLLAFNSPATYPQLYDPQYRFDLGHLNEAGAEVFSRLLAQRFVEMAKT